jgi:peroxiredoxin
MKKLLSILFILGFSSMGIAQSNSYKIKMTVKGIQDSACYLISYFGNQRYYKDTANFDSKGTVIFSGENQIESGIYGVYTGGNVLFEIIVDEAEIELTTDTSNYVKNMKVIKSVENKIFLEHINYVGERQRRSQTLRKKYTEKEIKTEEKEKIEKELKKIDDEVKQFQLDVTTKYPKSFVSTIFKLMIEPEIPKYTDAKNDSVRKLLRYDHYKNHFFDDVDFSDARINRTPIYHNKLEKYFKSVVYPHPDSINKRVDFVIEKAKANDDLFKYTVHFLINKYERSKIMGMESVFVHIALKYYTHELAFWVDAAQIDKVQERAKKIEPLLIGKPAINLSLLDTAGKEWVNMYKIQSNYTVLIFWDPECGHCKKELPKILEYYHTIKDKGVSVYAVSSDHNEAWKKFIRDNQMDFINVAVPKEVYKDQQKATDLILKGYTDLKSLNYTTTYDVFTTPQIYLLDKDKKIIAKKLDADLLKQVMEREWKKTTK